MAELGNTHNSRKENRKRSKREARWAGLRSTTGAVDEKSTQLVSATDDLTTHITPAGAPQNTDSRKSWYRMAVMGVAAALVGTIALPAYAMDPGASENVVFGSDYENQESQSVVNSSTVSVTASRDSYSAAAAVRQIASTGGSRASLGSLLSNPPNPNFSLSGIFNEGLKYVGTPYSSGGSTPAGFDCSGFTSYVYATFGIALPHNSEAQRSMGTAISEADAQPGDIVWMPGHVGLWAGPGMMLDSPVPGSTVQVRSIWTSNYQVIRIGI